MNCLAYFVLTVYVVAVRSQLTVKPSNVAADTGSRVTFYCSLTRGSAVWKHYDVTGRSNCVAYINGSDSNCLDLSRYSVTPDGEQFNLVIQSTQLSDAGTYVCQYEPNNYTASAVYSVVESKPTITVNDACWYEGGSVVISCETTYNGSSAMPLIITWADANGIVVKVDEFTSAGLIKSDIFVTPTGSLVPAHTCTVTFRAPACAVIPPQATNAPDYRSSTTMTPFAVSFRYCPRSLVITKADGEEFNGGNMVEGDVLICGVSGFDANVFTSFKWINEDGSSTGRSGIELKVGVFSKTCIATSILACTSTSSTKRCGSLNKTVNGAAAAAAQPLDRECKQAAYRKATIALSVIMGVSCLLSICTWCGNRIIASRS